MTEQLRSRNDTEKLAAIERVLTQRRPRLYWPGWKRADHYASQPVAEGNA